MMKDLHGSTVFFLFPLQIIIKIHAYVYIRVKRTLSGRK